MATESLVSVPEAIVDRAIQPYAAAQPVRLRLPYPRLLAAITTGLLLCLSHFHVMPDRSLLSGDGGGTAPGHAWLAWFALVPLLTLVRVDLALPKRRIFMCSWLGGLVFFIPAIQWMRVADPRMYFMWFLLATYCSLYVPLAVLVLRRLDRGTRLPLVITVPVVWTALEFFRSHFLGGFSWYLLAHTQHDFLPIIQISDLAGAYAVTFLVAAVNALVFEVMYSRGWFRSLMSLEQGAQPATRSTLAIQACAVLLAFAGTLAYGAWRLKQEDFGPGPRVALIQGSLSQKIRNEASGGGSRADFMKQHYAELTDRAVGQVHPPDLLIWPETSYPDKWYDVAPDDSGRMYTPESDAAWHTHARTKLNRDMLARVRDWRVPLLIGTNSSVLRHRPAMDFFYNSAILVVPGDRALVDGYAIRAEDLPDERGILTVVAPGSENLHAREAMPIRKGMRLPAGADAVVWLERAHVDADRRLAIDDRLERDHPQPVKPGQNVMGVAGRYDKIHLVPFGEYMPFRDWLPFVDHFAPYDFDYSVDVGEHWTRFPLTAQGREFRFGTIICYEDSDPPLTRKYARTTDDGPPVDFLVNISNDGWFDGTSEHEEHLALCRFRAVECRRSIVRAVNMGISAVIDGNGRVLAPITIRQDGDDCDWEISRDLWNSDLPPSRWRDFKKTRGVLTAEVPIDQRMSLYAIWGDWLPLCCWVVLTGGICWTIWRRRAMV